MTVVILERVLPSVRGDLTRWLLELRAGVFVGRVPAGVRDRLWERVCANIEDGGAMLVHAADNEQGFAIRVWGDPNRDVVDFEGLQLIRVP